MKGWPLAIRRRWWQRQERPEPYGSLLSTDLPSRRTPFSGLELVCLDMETTGLDAASAEVLSVGWLLVRRNRAELKSAAHCLVRPDGAVGESATVHGITDSVVAGGLPIDEVISRVVSILPGRVLVVHHAGLDKAIIDRECMRAFGAPLPVPVIDTLALEQRWRRRAHHLSADGSLRLADLRNAYHLPWYSGHDALADALATAELLLAMVAARGGAEKVLLADLV
jgi:DNA polymerase-3 subunit epsilon